MTEISSSLKAAVEQVISASFSHSIQEDRIFGRDLSSLQQGLKRVEARYTHLVELCIADALRQQTGRFEVETNVSVFVSEHVLRSAEQSGCNNLSKKLFRMERFGDFKLKFNIVAYNRCQQFLYPIVMVRRRSARAVFAEPLGAKWETAAFLLAHHLTQRGLRLYGHTCGAVDWNAVGYLPPGLWSSQNLDRVLDVPINDTVAGMEAYLRELAHDHTREICGSLLDMRVRPRSKSGSKTRRKSTRVQQPTIRDNGSSVNLRECLLGWDC